MQKCISLFLEFLPLFSNQNTEKPQNAFMVGICQGKYVAVDLMKLFGLSFGLREPMQP